MKIGVIKDKWLLYLFFIILYFEGTYLPLIYAVIKNVALIKFMLFFKYILVLVYALVYIVRYIKGFKTIDFLDLLSFITIIYFSLILSFVAIVAENFKLSNVTTFIFPFLIYICGRSINVTEIDIKKYINIIIWCSVFMFLYAIIDVLFIPDTFWRDYLAQGQYLLDVKDYNADGIIDGLIGNFYFNPFSEDRFRRAVGFSGDPLAFAYSMVFTLLAVYYFGYNQFKNRFSYLLVTFIGIVSLLLSFTRAIILSAFIVLILNRLFKKHTIYLTFIIGLIALFILSFAGPLIGLILGLNDSSSMGHLGSLGGLSDFSMENIWAGNLIIDPNAMTRFESSFLGILFNFGIIGVILFYGSLILILRRLYNINIKYAYIVSLTGAIGMLTSIVFSESFLSFTGYGFFWFNAGIAISYTKFLKNEDLY